MKFTTLLVPLLSVAGALAEPAADASSGQVTSSATTTRTRTVYMVTTQTKTGAHPTYAAGNSTSYAPTGTAPYSTGTEGSSAPTSPAPPAHSFVGAATQLSAAPIMVVLAGVAMAFGL